MDVDVSVSHEQEKPVTSEESHKLNSGVIVLTSISSFVGLQRVARLNHGVDPDSREKNPLISIAVHPERSDLIATGGHEGTVCLWKLMIPGEIDPNSVSNPVILAEPVTTLVGHSGQVNVVRFSPQSGRFLATGSADCTVRIYSMEQRWNLVHSLRGHRLDVNDMGWFSPTILITCGADGKAIVWDAVTGGKLQELTSERSSCPKGIIVDLEYMCVLFDGGLIDVYRRTVNGEFRLSRQIDLPKDDGRNFEKSVRTTLYPRRGAWTPDGRQLLLPLGVRRHLPCGVMYDRGNLLEPSPNEEFASSRVYSGHPARIVLVSVKPEMHAFPGEDPFFISALVSVDGVLSLWSSASCVPIAVVANLLGPSGVCTDSAWSGNTLLLTSSDGAVTCVSFYNLGSIHASKLSQPPLAPLSIPLSDSVRSSQFEVRIGGKRKIQPVLVSPQPLSNVTPSYQHAAQLSASFDGSLVKVSNSGSSFTVESGQRSWTVTEKGAVSAIALNEHQAVLGVVSDGWFSISILSMLDGSEILSSIFMPDIVLALSFTSQGLLGILTSSACAVWRVASDGLCQAVIPDAPFTGLFASDPPESLELDPSDSGPIVLLKSRNRVKFSVRLGRWTKASEN